VSLTLERLREVLDYSPESGLLVWKTLMARNNNIGRPAGGPDKHGYICLNLDKKRYYAHRLAWFHFYGEWPKACIDHINGNPADNRITNLRDVPQLLNMQNRRAAATKRKHKLPLGVIANASPINPFTARIRINGQPTHLGNFPTPEAAHRAYVEAKRLHHAGGTI
jgi:hypothetical protein